MFRLIHYMSCTIGIDETERYHNPKDPGMQQIRQLLNSGYKQGMPSIRLIVEDMRLDTSYLELNGSTSPVTLTLTDTALQMVSVRVVQNDNDHSNRATIISHSIAASIASEYPVGMVLSVKAGLVHLGG